MPSFDVPKSIEQKVSDAFRRADETGVPQEVLGDDGKRVMLIVCPKTPLGYDADALRADLDAALADAARERERAEKAEAMKEGWENEAYNRGCDNDTLRTALAESRAERYRELIKRAWPFVMKHEATRPCLEWLRDAGAALAETEKENP